MQIAADAIVLIGLAAVGSSLYSLLGAFRGLGIRDSTWVLMRKEEGPIQYYWIVIRTGFYLFVGLALLALGIFKLTTNHWGLYR